MIDAAQCRQARASLRMSRPELARLAAVSSAQIKRFEAGSNPRATVTDQIERALAAASRGLEKDDVEMLHVILNEIADLVYCISSALMKPQPARELFGEIHRSASLMRDCAMPPRVQRMSKVREAAE
jgi:transcriptional regulator with XRE-family HTH domain